MPNIKNQHYVPQFYLKGFTDNKKQVWAFDKATLKSFASSSTNLASESYFYDQEILDKALGKNFIEKALEEVEGKTAPLLKKLLKDLDIGRAFSIDRETKVQLCEYLTIQLIRTREHRHGLSHIINATCQGLLENGHITEEQAKEMGLEADPDMVKRYQLAQLMPTEPLRQQLPIILASHIWLLYKNETGMPFFASDHPVARKPHIIASVPSFIGSGQKGIEIAFPLSPKYLLRLCERSHFHELEQNENKMQIIADLKDISYYNSLQVQSSSRFVYSCRSDFGLAEEMIIANKALGDPDRDRTGFV